MTIIGDPAQTPDETGWVVDPNNISAQFGDANGDGKCETEDPGFGGEALRLRPFFGAGLFVTPMTQHAPLLHGILPQDVAKPPRGTDPAWARGIRQIRVVYVSLRRSGCRS